MLMQTNGIAVTGLLEDLLKVRDRISKGWASGSFSNGAGGVCIMEAVNEITDHKKGQFHSVRGEELSENDLRYGRIVLSVHEAIYGPEGTPDDMTVSAAAAHIAEFNDSPEVRKDVVLHALDVAINELMAPPVVSEVTVPSPVTVGPEDDEDQGREDATLKVTVDA